MKRIITSKKYTINYRDILKGLLAAMVTGVVGTCGTLINDWFLSASLLIDKKDLIIIFKAAFAGGISYIFTKFFESSKVIIKPNSQEEKDQVIEAIKTVEVENNSTPAL